MEKALRMLGMLASFVADEVARAKGKDYDTGEEYTRIVIRNTPLLSIRNISPDTLKRIHNAVVGEMLMRGIDKEPIVREFRARMSYELLKSWKEIENANPVSIAFYFAETVNKNREEALKELKKEIQ